MVTGDQDPVVAEVRAIRRQLAVLTGLLIDAGNLRARRTVNAQIVWLKARGLSNSEAAEIVGRTGNYVAVVAGKARRQKTRRSKGAKV